MARFSGITGPLQGHYQFHDPAQTNYRMKLAGRGRPFVWNQEQPNGGWAGLAGLAASLQLMRGR